MQEILQHLCLPISFGDTARLMIGAISSMMRKTARSLGIRMPSGYFNLECLVHADSSVSIVAYIFCMDLCHGITKLLIFPWTLFVHQILTLRHEASCRKTDFPFACTVCCLERVNFIRLVLLTSDDSWRKSLVFPRKSFSFSRHRMSLSCDLC